MMRPIEEGGLKGSSVCKVDRRECVGPLHTAAFCVSRERRAGTMSERVGGEFVRVEAVAAEAKVPPWLLRRRLR